MKLLTDDKSSVNTEYLINGIVDTESASQKLCPAMNKQCVVSECMAWEWKTFITKAATIAERDLNGMYYTKPTIEYIPKRGKCNFYTTTKLKNVE